MNRYLQTLICHRWRNKLSEQELPKIKSITMDYLKKIGAQIEESNGLYIVDIPDDLESTFGAKEKRITFDPEIASTHSCELVIFGSNFLSTILNEIKKHAPVITGSLKKKSDFSVESLENIPVYRGTFTLGKIEEIEKVVLRFYFNVNIKSVKSESSLQWIDIEPRTLDRVKFPKELNLEPLENNIDFDKESVDVCYDQALGILEKEIIPIIEEHEAKTTEDKNQDLNSLESSFEKRESQIYQNIRDQRYKLQVLEYKIGSAKKYSTQNRYIEQKYKLHNKISQEESEAIVLINKLRYDKEIQQEHIIKRYATKVNSTLVASTVFSYSITKFSLEIKSQNMHNDIVGEYIGHSQELIIPCGVCNVNTKEIHLCVNGHVGCNLCSSICATCENDFCRKCEFQIHFCYECKEKNCNDCSANCVHCSEFMCNRHKMNCVICDKNYCSKHSEYCSNCEQTYDIGCVEKGQCSTCSELTLVDSTNLMVQEIISVNSELSKYNKWEYSSNKKFSVFRVKKMFNKKILVFDKLQKKVIVDKKDSWF